MNKLVLSITCLLAASSLSAQNTKESGREGKVSYQEIMKLDIKLEGDAAQFASALPKERKSSKTLLFNTKASIYQNNTDEESAEDVAMEQGGMMVKINMMEPDNQYYTNLEKKITIEKREFMSRNFLIEGKLDASGWKLTGEQKTILDYPCQKAVRSDDEGKKTIVWFTPSVPVSSGPANFIGLPGLVLEVEMQGGDHRIFAKEIEFIPVNKKELAKPKKGKKVSKEEFDKIVEEKMKEMGAEHGEGGGTFIMRIEK
ncbi:MAG: GLPGLI family protein [Bacteroidales bacterium]|nr:GLPGLI family protein [Bacteroidales bacterium]